MRLYARRFKALGEVPTVYFGLIFGLVGSVYGHFTSFLVTGLSFSPKAQFRRHMQRVIYMSGCSMLGFAFGVNQFGNPQELKSLIE